MDFTNFLFWAVFLPAVFLGYIIVPRKLKNAVLAAASLAFYAAYHVFFYRRITLTPVFVLLMCVVLTFFGGKLGDRYLSKGEIRKGKRVLLATLSLNLMVLLVFKYTQFVVSNINGVNQAIGLREGTLTVPALLAPVGLSFFIFQSSSYLLDLYNGRTRAETSLINYTLFVSFFASIISGPIQRSFRFLPQIREKRSLTWNRVQSVFSTFLWGAFLKLVVANRLAVFTNAVYQNISGFGFGMLVLAAVAYSVQIYADFSGYSFMAIAVAGIFGFDFPENFSRPYAATTIADFWRRWHISLSSWFRDYLYIPLGGNRKGRFRKYANLAIVFLVSGLWHGASWNFVLWGGIHAAYQIIGDMTKPFRISLCQSLGINRDSFSFRLWQRAFVFLAVTFAWVFFRLESVESLAAFFSAISRSWELGTLFTGVPAALGLDVITVSACALLVCVSSLRESGTGLKWFFDQSMALRFLCYFLLILSMVLFGKYGPDFSASSFIYAGF